MCAKGPDMHTERLIWLTEDQKNVFLATRSYYHDTINILTIAAVRGHVYEMGSVLKKDQKYEYILLFNEVLGDSVRWPYLIRLELEFECYDTVNTAKVMSNKLVNLRTLFWAGLFLSVNEYLCTYFRQ